MAWLILSEVDIHRYFQWTIIIPSLSYSRLFTIQILTKISKLQFKYLVLFC